RALTRADLAEARAYHAEARSTVLTAEGDVYLRGVSLAREVGASDAAPLRTAGPPPSPPIPGAAHLAALLGQAATLPLVELRVLQARAARAREVEDHAARGTILQVGAGVQRDAPGGLVVSGLARVTFPLFERGERERAGMRAEAAALDGERASALLAARADLASSVHEVEHTAAMLAVVRDDLVPASREAAQTRRRIFENGGATLLEVLQSDRAAVVAASRQWRIEAEHAWARTKLWLMLAEIALKRSER
ncbi:MAG TPA: TolC family protein, partial [Polyangia bacterium]